MVLNMCPRARGAGYEHGDRRGCLTGTRETLLDEIESWARNFDASPIFWLNGAAGSGKSTIARTVAERLFADGSLGASFFCSRDFQDRSNPRFIFPTLTLQLARKYQDFRSTLVPFLRSNPDIGYESLDTQMEWLIATPLKRHDISTIIIIDALDECADYKQQSSILSAMDRFVEEIPKIKFFITGRPEPHIQSGFRLQCLNPLTNIFVLHDIERSAVDADIQLFLTHQPPEIANQQLATSTFDPISTIEGDVRFMNLSSSDTDANPAPSVVDSRRTFVNGGEQGGGSRPSAARDLVPKHRGGESNSISRHDGQPQPRHTLPPRPESSFEQPSKFPSSTHAQPLHYQGEISARTLVMRRS